MPPAGGFLYPYQTFSSQATTREPPICRTQSTERAPKVPPPGTVTALR